MSKNTGTTSTSDVEAKVAQSQTDTGAPNDQRAAAAQHTQPLGSHGDASRAGAPARSGTLPPAANPGRMGAERGDGSHTGDARDARDARDASGLRSHASRGEGTNTSGDGMSPNAEDGAKALSVNAGNIEAGKELYNNTPQVATEDVLAHTAPGTPLAAQRHATAPIIHAPTVTPKGKLGYMATPSLPVGGAAPGVNQAAPAKPDFFTQPIVETSVTKGSKVDGRDGKADTGGDERR